MRAGHRETLRFVLSLGVLASKPDSVFWGRVADRVRMERQEPWGGGGLLSSGWIT